MNFAPFVNAMRLQAARVAASRFETQHGIVENYDPVHYCVKVSLQPEGTLTGYIPLASAWVGNGWGMFAPPSIGDVIAVTFFNGSLDTGYAELRFYNNNNQPLSVPSGEFWIVHKTNSALKFHNDGTIELITNSDLNATIGGDLNATVAGDLSADITGDVTLSANSATVNAPTTINDDLTVTGTVTCADLITDVITSANTHVHGNGNGGANTTGPQG